MIIRRELFSERDWCVLKYEIEEQYSNSRHTSIMHLIRLQSTRRCCLFAFSWSSPVFSSPVPVRCCHHEWIWKIVSTISQSRVELSASQPIIHTILTSKQSSNTESSEEMGTKTGEGDDKKFLDGCWMDWWTGSEELYVKRMWLTITKLSNCLFCCCCCCFSYQSVRGIDWSNCIIMLVTSSRGLSNSLN